MTVIAPGDAEGARKAVIASVTTDGPVYLRFGRAPTPCFTTSESPFHIGKALVLWDSKQPNIAFLSTGSISYATLSAARALAEDGIESVVLHVPTIKPLDTEDVLNVARRAGRVITVEEHQVAGGFGSAIAECLVEHHPVPMRLIGIQDQFGQSGSPEELLTHYGLDSTSIENVARKFLTHEI